MGYGAGGSGECQDRVAGVADALAYFLEAAWKADAAAVGACGVGEEEVVGEVGTFRIQVGILYALSDDLFQGFGRRYCPDAARRFASFKVVFRLVDDIQDEVLLVGDQVVILCIVGCGHEAEQVWVPVTGAGCPFIAASFEG